MPSATSFASQPRRTRASRPRVGRGLAIALTAAAAIALAFGTAWWRDPARIPVPQVTDARLEARVAEALRQARDRVVEQPASAGMWGSYGMVLRAYERNTEARICLERAAALDPRDGRWPYLLGVILESEQPVAGTEWLKRSIPLLPAPEAARLRLLRRLAESGDWTGARAGAAELAASAPGFVPARLLQANAERMLGRMTEAAELASACTNDPRTQRGAWSLLATAWGRMGRSAEATEAARISAALPEDQKVADPVLDQVSALRQDARVSFAPLHSLLASGRLAEAEPEIRRLIRDFPDEAETWLIAGRWHFLGGRPEDAIAALERHLALSPDSIQGLFQLGSVQLKQARFESAATAFRRCAALKPDFAAAQFNLGFSLARAGQRAEALAPFREALRLGPDHFETYLLLGDLLLQLDQRGELPDLLARADRIRPGDARLAALRRKAGL